MPPARQAMHLAGEQIHVAVWPWVHETHLMASRHYAFEGRCVVLAVGLIMPHSDLPDELECPEGDHALLLRGGSAVIGPDGQYLLEPVYDREELLLCDVDLEAVERERMTLDVAGHYARHDVFRLSIDDTRPGSDA